MLPLPLPPLLPHFPIHFSAFHSYSFQASSLPIMFPLPLHAFRPTPLVLGTHPTLPLPTHSTTTSLSLHLMISHPLLASPPTIPPLRILPFTLLLSCQCSSDAASATLPPGLPLPLTYFHSTLTLSLFCQCPSHAAIVNLPPVLPLTYFSFQSPVYTIDLSPPATTPTQLLPHFQSRSPSQPVTPSLLPLAPLPNPHLSFLHLILLQHFLFHLKLPPTPYYSP